jgi:hypothetical protein
MVTVNNFTNSSDCIPIRDDPMIMCPVDDTGKNSVRPSIMARMMP